MGGEGGGRGFHNGMLLLKLRLAFLMDVHQWHCNTELELDDPKKSFRMSFVLYLRDAMTGCSENNKTTLNGIDYWLKK